MNDTMTRNGPNYNKIDDMQGLLSQWAGGDMISASAACSAKSGALTVPTRIAGIDSSSDDDALGLVRVSQVGMGMQKKSDKSGAVTVPTRIPGIDSSSDDDRRCSGLRRNDGFRDSSDDDMQGLISQWAGGHMRMPRREISDEDLSDGGHLVQNSKRGAGRIVRGQRTSHAARRSERVALSREEAIEAALQFQPLVVEEKDCQALMWNLGRGRMQCRRLPLPGTRLCKHHKTAAHGEVRGPIPANKLEQFRKEFLKPEKDSKQWYARYLMWGVASQISPDISSLSDLTPEQYEVCLRKVNVYVSTHHLTARLKQGVGVRGIEDQERGDKFGSTR